MDALEYERRLQRVRKLLSEHGFDGLVTSDFANPPQLPYARYLSGFQIPASSVKDAVVAIVPLDGEPKLVVPSGILGSFYHAACAKSWIKSVSSSFSDDIEEESRTHWGKHADFGDSVMHAIRDAGLMGGRVAVAGSWPGAQQTQALLSETVFQSTLVTRDDGSLIDLLEPTIDGLSVWELERLRAAHAAADAMISRFIEVARRGGSIKEARVEATIAGYRAGADRISLFGSFGADPWAYWDWSLAPDDGRFVTDHIYFVQAALVAVDGYEVQSARSFVAGAPNARQRELGLRMQESLHAMHEALHVGQTGADLWKRGIGPLTRSGLVPWGQFGHLKGFSPKSRRTGIHVLPEDGNRLEAGQALTLHVCARDRATGQLGMTGDTVVVDASGNWQYLTDPQLSHDLSMT